MSNLTFTDCENSLIAAKEFLSNYYDNMEMTSDYDDAHFQVILSSLKDISDILYNIATKDIQARKESKSFKN